MKVKCSSVPKSGAQSTSVRHRTGTEAMHECLKISETHLRLKVAAHGDCLLFTLKTPAFCQKMIHETCN